MYFASFNKKWEIIIDLRSSIISYILFKNRKYIFKKNKSFSHLNQLKNFFELPNTNMKIHTSIEENNIAKSILNKNLKYIVIFPGGNWIPKIWPTQNYNKLINLLIKEFSNVRFVMVGSLQEKEIFFKKIKNNLTDDYFINLMGESLTLTSAYMKNCNLFIGNDSGLMHLSIASNLTTIGLFGPTNDKIYGHRGNNAYVIRTKETYNFFDKITIDNKKSYMSSIEPKEVLDLIKQKKLI